VNLLVDIKKASETFLSSGFRGLCTKVLTVIRRRVMKTLYTQIDENAICAGIITKNLSGGVMIDVGAHHGTSLRPFLEHDFTVYAFEPDARNRKQLLINYKHPHPGALHVDQRAVSSVNSINNTFYSSELSTGISGLSAFDQSHSISGVVDTVTLALFCADKAITQIDYLKIDTEGFDLKVLEGLDFQSVIPTMILCEFEDKKTIPIGYTWSDLAEFLSSRGYIVLVCEWFPIKKYGGQHRFRRVERYPCKLKRPDGWGNIVAVKSESLASEFETRVEEFLGKKLL